MYESACGTGACSVYAHAHLLAWSQVAVPKYLSLHLDPASGADLAVLGSPITQSISIVNNAHGSKALALRLRIAFKRDGQDFVELADVTNMPAGL